MAAFATNLCRTPQSGPGSSVAQRTDVEGQEAATLTMLISLS
jgi:hypothetical protein